MKQIYNTRIAPSPTGDMHIGTLRTAYFNWLIARASGGRFIVRIDDTDLTRSDDSKIQPIYDALAWVGLDYDKTMKQSNRFVAYKGMADFLVDGGKATKHRDGSYTLNYMFDVQDTSILDWDDTIAGKMTPNAQISSLLDDMVLIKRDGSPTYNFCSAVDDIQHGINWVVRGKDHIINTFRQMAIYRALEVDDIPKFTHLGLLCKNKKKLSKRDGAAAVSDYQIKGGIHPQAMLNYLVRFGWSPTKDDRTNKYIDRDKALGMFLTQGRMRNSNANIDADKLKFYNSYYNRNYATGK